MTYWERARELEARAMASLWPCAIAIALVLWALPSQAAALPGSLDRSFGRNGKLLIPTAPEPSPEKKQALSQGTSEVSETEMAMVSAPGEKLVVAGRGQVLRLMASGRPDPDFGDNGRVDIAVEPNTAFQLGGVVMDSQRRVLIAGTTEVLNVASSPGPPGFANATGPRPQQATVYRYLPDGSPDPSFGQGGAVTSTFDLPHPIGPGPYDSTYPIASVGATDIAVDANDNPIVSGLFVSGVGACYTGVPTVYVGEAYVARLTSTGTLDQRFGKNGTALDAQMEYPTVLKTSGAGETVYYGPRSTHCSRGGGPEFSLVKLHSDGSFDQDFATEGRLTQPNLDASAITLSPEAKITLFGRYGNEPTIQSHSLVRRFEANGSRDPRFGRAGSARPRILVGIEASDVAVDSRGRVLLAGTPRVSSLNGDFAIARLSARGRVDLSFGNGGRRITNFGGSPAEAEQLAIGSDGRIVVGGPVRSTRLATGHAFAFARYLPGR